MEPSAVIPFVPWARFVVLPFVSWAGLVVGGLLVGYSTICALRADPEPVGAEEPDEAKAAQVAGEGAQHSALFDDIEAFCAGYRIPDAQAFECPGGTAWRGTLHREGRAIGQANELLDELGNRAGVERSAERRALVMTARQRVRRAESDERRPPEAEDGRILMSFLDELANLELVLQPAAAAEGQRAFARRQRGTIVPAIELRPRDSLLSEPPRAEATQGEDGFEDITEQLAAWIGGPESSDAAAELDEEAEGEDEEEDEDEVDAEPASGGPSFVLDAPDGESWPPARPPRAESFDELAQMLVADDAWEATDAWAVERGVSGAGPQGHTLLHIAAREGRVASARKLLSRGADVNAPDALGMTAPMWAAAAGQKEALRLFAEALSPVDWAARDKQGRDVLAWARQSGSAPCVALAQEMLHGGEAWAILAGSAREADLSLAEGARDAEGRDARDRALAKGHAACVAAIEQARGAA